MSPITGLSLYDSLSKLIVGMLLLLLLIPLPTCYQPELWGNPLFYIVSFIVGALYNIAMHNLTNFLRNNMRMIKSAQKKVFDNIINTNKSSDSTADCIEPYIIENINDYYKAYYTAVHNKMLTNVPALEAHESFFRNIFFIEILYLTALLADCPNIIEYLGFLGSQCTVALSFIIIIIGTCACWCYTQMKIYQLVIEGYYYGDLLQQKRLNSGTNSEARTTK